MENTEKKIKYQIETLPKGFIHLKNSEEIISIFVSAGTGLYEDLSISDGDFILECTMEWNIGTYKYEIPVNKLIALLSMKPFNKITFEDLQDYDKELWETRDGNLSLKTLNSVDFENTNAIVELLKGSKYEIEEEELEDADSIIEDRMQEFYSNGYIGDSEIRFYSLFELNFEHEIYGSYSIDWDYHKKYYNNCKNAYDGDKYGEAIEWGLKFLFIHIDSNISEYLNKIKAIENNKDEELNEVLKYIAYSFEKENNFHEAIKYYEYILILDPKNEFANTQMGKCHSNLGENENAISFYMKTIEINPKNVKTIIECSDLLKQLEKLTEAIEILKFGTTQNTESSWLFQTLGHTYFEKEDWINSMESYEKALEIENISAVTNRRLGTVYYNLKKFELAITKLQKSQVLDDYFKDTFTYYYIGESFKNLGQFQNAIDQYLNCINLKADNVHVYAYGSLGFCYLKINDFENCIKYSSKGLKESFNLQNVGKAYFGIKNYSKALEKFNEVIEINANYKWAYHWKGDSLFELQKYSEALESYNKLLELDPNYTNYKDCGHIAERIIFINSLNKF